jgi:phytoene synthase
MESFGIVRQFDKDRFLATLFAPEDKQPHLFAVYAFTAEVARIPHLVSEPQIGEIRLQWWHDTVEAIFAGTAQEHPVAQELAATIQAYNLPKQSFLNLIEALRFDLYADEMPSRNDLEGYLGETQSALIQLASMILSPDQANAEASGLAGVAYGLARLNADPKFLPKGETTANLQALAKARLDQLRLIKITPNLFPAFLPVSLTELYLKSSTPAQWRKQWRMWRAAGKEIL